MTYYIRYVQGAPYLCDLCKAFDEGSTISPPSWQQVLPNEGLETLLVELPTDLPTNYATLARAGIPAESIVALSRDPDIPQDIRELGRRAESLIRIKGTPIRRVVTTVHGPVAHVFSPWASSLIHVINGTDGLVESQQRLSQSRFGLYADVVSCQSDQVVVCHHPSLVVMEP